MIKNSKNSHIFFIMINIILFCIIIPVQSLGLTKHALIIGIDGARFDAVDLANTPNIDSIKVNGTWTHNAFSGGVLGTVTQQETASAQSWTTIFTGVWQNKHGVTNSTFEGSQLNKYPNFFKRIKDHDSTIFLASIVSWGTINSHILSDGDADLEEHLRDPGVTEHVAELLKNGNPNVVFLHFDELDGVGHRTGFLPTNPEYISYIETLDGYVGIMLNAMRSRPTYNDEDWMVLVITDHGGNAAGHGMQSEEERAVFIYKNSRESKSGELIDLVDITAIAPTVLEHFDIPIDPEWKLEGKPFGIPVPEASNFFPTNDARNIPVDVNLTWKPGENAISHNIYLGTDSNLDDAFVGNQTDSLYNPGGLNERTPYYWRIDEVTDVDTIPGTINNFITLASTPYNTGTWTFNNSMNGVENFNGYFYGGTPTYVDGVLDKAIHLDGVDDYIVLGNEFDFNFGAETDYSISIWVRTNVWKKSAPIITNKNWDSGSNRGWIIACGYSTTTWQWNYAYKLTKRENYKPSSPKLKDGNWHHLCVTHDRDGYAKFYFDGEMQDSIDISDITKSIDSGFPTVIGNDGTLNYSPLFCGDIDELNIFNYILPQSKIDALYALTDVRINPDDEVIDKYFLANNYPNPFNSNTTIKYGVKESSNVKIMIYNTRGQIVEQLMNKRHIPGEYQIKWNCRDLSSGIYFIKMSTNDRIIKINKSILLK